MTGEKKKSIKDETFDYISSLPEDVTLDKIIYHLTVRLKIAKGLDDLEHGRVKSHEEVKKWIQERFDLKEDQLDIETMLLECCKMRGNPTSLIHRTIHEFNWFYQNLIFDKSKIINDQYAKLSDLDLIELITHRNIPQNDDYMLRSVVSLFYQYCKHIYNV